MTGGKKGVEEKEDIVEKEKEEENKVNRKIEKAEKREGTGKRQKERDFSRKVSRRSSATINYNQYRRGANTRIIF